MATAFRLLLLVLATVELASAATPKAAPKAAPKPAPRTPPAARPGPTPVPAPVPFGGIKWVSGRISGALLKPPVKNTASGTVTVKVIGTQLTYAINIKGLRDVTGFAFFDGATGKRFPDKALTVDKVVTRSKTRVANSTKKAILVRGVVNVSAGTAEAFTSNRAYLLVTTQSRRNGAAKANLVVYKKINYTVNQ